MCPPADSTRKQHGLVFGMQLRCVCGLDVRVPAVVVGLDDGRFLPWCVVMRSWAELRADNAAQFVGEAGALRTPVALQNGEMGTVQCGVFGVGVRNQYSVSNIQKVLIPQCIAVLGTLEVSARP